MTREHDDAHAIAKRLKETNDYVDVRVLPDNSVATLLDLVYTRAICLGVNDVSWDRRFCFSDRNRANEEFAKLTSEDDIPTGFIASR